MIFKNMHKPHIYFACVEEVPISDLIIKMKKCKIEQWVCLCEDSTWLINMEHNLPSQVKRVQIVDELDNIAKSIRNDYIDWIGELSQINDSMEWWGSEISSKNPFYLLFIRICLLSLGFQFIQNGFDKPTLIVTSSQGMLGELLSLAKKKGVVTHIFKNSLIYTIQYGFKGIKERDLSKVKVLCPEFIYKRVFHYLGINQIDLILKKHQSKLSLLKLLENQGFYGHQTIAFLTWVDNRSFRTDGSFSDPYFGPLPEILKKKGYQVAYIARILHTILYKDAIQKLNLSGEHFFLPENFVKELDLSACYYAALNFSPKIPTDKIIGNVPVHRLAQEHIESTRCCLFESLLYGPMIRELAKSGIKPEIIIYPAEGHSCENVLIKAIRQFMPETRIIGYDNLTFSKMILSMFYSEKEQKIKPLPDRIVTNGQLYRDLLIQEGYPADKVITGCALRHTYLWNNNITSKNDFNDPNNRPIRILVATGISLGDSVELISKTIQAFGSNQEYKILIKCHPVVETRLIMSYFDDFSSTENISFVTEPISDLLKSANILLYNHTTVCYEALFSGVAPIFVRSETFLNLDKLDIAPKVRWIASTPKEIRDAVAAIRSMNPSQRSLWQEEAYNIASKALAPVSENSIHGFIDY